MNTNTNTFLIEERRFKPKKFTWLLLTLFSLILIATIISADVNIPARPTPAVNNATLSVNNSQYLQGLTPQQVANLYSETDPLWSSNSSTVVRAGNVNCTAGQVVMNVTVNSSGIFTYCIAVSASPGGADTNIQFNDASSFNGTGNFTLNKTSGNVRVNSILLNATGDNNNGGIGNLQNFENATSLALRLDGSNNYVTTSPTLSQAGGNFTIELWVYMTGNSGDRNILGEFKLKNSNAIGYQGSTSTITFPYNVWTHVAWMQNGTDLTFFINGTYAGKVTQASPGLSYTNIFGTQLMAGYIDEFRVSNIARYPPTGFTPPTYNFVNDSNTLMLMHFDEGSGTKLVDSSVAHTLTIINPQTSGWVQGKSIISAPLTAIIRGNISSVTQTQIGSIFDNRTLLNSPNLFSPVPNTSTSVAYIFDTVNNLTMSGAEHSSFRVNGFEIFGLTYDGSLTKLPLKLIQGAGSALEYFQAITYAGEIKTRIDNFFNFVSNNWKISGTGDRTVGGNFSIDALVPNGTTSSAMNLNGTQYASLATSNFGITSGQPFTVEAWLNAPSFAGDQYILGEYKLNGAKPAYKGNVGSTSLVANTWNHVAWVQTPTQLYIFLNGKQILSTASNSGGVSYGFIGSQSTFNFFTGQIDEFRISNIARYTTNFSVPQGQFTTDSNTKLLLHFNENTSTSAKDSSASANNATLQAGANWSTGVIPINNSLRNIISASWNNVTEKNTAFVGDTLDDITQLQGITAQTNKLNVTGTVVSNLNLGQNNITNATLINSTSYSSGAGNGLTGTYQIVCDVDLVGLTKKYQNFTYTGGIVTNASACA